jgi:hypothetical protein
MDNYVILSFSPLPPEFIKSLIAPYRPTLDKDVDVIVFRDVSDREKLFSYIQGSRCYNR